MPRISICGDEDSGLFRSIMNIFKIDFTEEETPVGFKFTFPKSPMFIKARTIHTMIQDFGCDQVNAGCYAQFPIGEKIPKCFKGDEREFTNGVCKLFGVLPTVELEKLVMDWAAEEFEGGKAMGRAYEADYKRQLAKKAEATK